MRREPEHRRMSAHQQKRRPPEGAQVPFQEGFRHRLRGVQEEPFERNRNERRLRVRPVALDVPQVRT